ncbi:MAG: RluA family pseudouridine synthase [Bacteroidia bacterium]|nr:RluA family pseudouridine synthase [Bacteroidia bacterium]
MSKTEYHVVPSLSEASRLSDYVPGIFEFITTRKGMKKAIKKGMVRVNGEIGNSGDHIKGGEVISLHRIEKQSKPINLDLEVLYEDDYLAIIHKPAGITVSGNRHWTIQNALVLNLKQSSQVDALANPEPIHRLDHPTSGALMIGKTSSVVVALNKMFQNQEVDKTYIAITVGDMHHEGCMNSMVNYKSATTNYTLLAREESKKYGFLNLVQLNPKTGRKHQLRIHLAEMGNPILGDKEYGQSGLILKGKGLYLHAYRLSFKHPITCDHMEVLAKLPKKFDQIFSNAVEAHATKSHAIDSKKLKEPFNKERLFK